MSSLVGFLVRQIGVGCLIGLGVSWLLLEADVGRIATLIAGHPEGDLALALLVFGICSTTATIHTGLSLALLGDGEES
jgi:NhaP-type Na+/H+ and K+/H+ antiporter